MSSGASLSRLSMSRNISTSGLVRPTWPEIMVNSSGIQSWRPKAWIFLSWWRWEGRLLSSPKPTSFPDKRQRLPDCPRSGPKCPCWSAWKHPMDGIGPFAGNLNPSVRKCLPSSDRYACPSWTKHPWPNPQRPHPPGKLDREAPTPPLPGP